MSKQQYLGPIKRRSMIDNALDEEVYKIRRLRGQVDTVEEHKRQRTLDIMSSGPISDAVDAELKRKRKNNDNYGL
ncbi:hypothetical protein A3K64_03380 [Candidatus Micrarchaeota archaeon RBG_16_36_9]|nr:MAG: hypothetical protein A3K64_03380 [Candidatus Micrarchaeota archaeon RBG_16_36_9]